MYGCEVFYLKPDSMSQYKYIQILLEIIPENFRLKYDIYNYNHGRYMYAEFRKIMYRLPQIGYIAHNQLVEIM